MNAFVPEFTNLLKGLNRLHDDAKYLFGKNARTQLTRRNEEDDKVSRDYMLKLTTLSLMFDTSVTTKEEAAEVFVHACDYDVSGDGSKVNSQVKGKRFELLMRHLREKGLINDEELLTLFEKAYKSSRLNGGNTTNHRNPTKSEMSKTDIALTEFAASGDRFFVQSVGTSGDNPKNR